MAKPIKVGDLVVQFKDCCGKNPDTGKIGIARVVHRNITRCDQCRQIHGGIHVSAVEGGAGCPISWVKRIPPLSELDGVKKDEENTA